MIGETIKCPNCFCKIMPRPYHKWEELIREYFLEFPDDEIPIQVLLQEITDNDLNEYSKDYDNIYNAVCRAIRKLEKEGFLESKIMILNRAGASFNGNKIDTVFEHASPSKMKYIQMKRDRHYVDEEWDIEREEPTD